MRNRFDRQLVTLNQELTSLGMMIEEAIAGAVDVVIKGDPERAKSIIANDEEINHEEREIESLCMKMLLQQQPVARDLRKISSALKMITDMERIGDQAADICEIVVKNYVSPTSILPEIREMTGVVIGMVNEAVEAYVNTDAELAGKVIGSDMTVDSLFNKVKTELVESIRTNSSSSGEAIDVLMIAKYLEKIGDHAVNVAGWVIFSITGEHME